MEKTLTSRFAEQEEASKAQKAEDEKKGSDDKETIDRWVFTIHHCVLVMTRKP